MLKSFNGLARCGGAAVLQLGAIHKGGFNAHAWVVNYEFMSSADEIDGPGAAPVKTKKAKKAKLFADFDSVFETRIAEADEFYARIATGELLQILRLRPALTAVPSFEFALRERTARLANFRHAYYARVRRVEVLDRLREASPEIGVGLAGMRERLNELSPVGIACGSI